MNTSNNFKKLLEEDELRFPPPPDIQTNVLGSLKILAIMGQAMELYIPKVFEMFIITLGGTLKEVDEISKNELGSGDSGTDEDGEFPGFTREEPLIGS